MENCGHVSMCEDHNNLTRCPICRAKGKVIRIYASLLDWLLNDAILRFILQEKEYFDDLNVVILIVFW